MIRSGSEPGSTIDSLIYYAVVGVAWTEPKPTTASLLMNVNAASVMDMSGYPSIEERQLNADTVMQTSQKKN